MKKKILLPLIVLATLSLGACTGSNSGKKPDEPTPVDPTKYGVEIANKAEVSAAEFYVGSNRTLTVNLTPAANALQEIQKGNLKITSNNPAVATVSGLGINAVAEGQAVIEVEYHGAKDTVAITVEPKVVVNYGSEESPLTPSQVLTEIAKLKLADKGYSPERFYVKGTLKGTVTGSNDSYKFKLTDGTSDISFSSTKLQEGKQASDYKNGDILTVVGYGRASTSYTEGYYITYNTSAAAATAAPQVIDYEEGGGGEVVPEPAVATKTLSEFIALQYTTALAFEVTAEVKSVKGDKYGNMTLVEPENHEVELEIYGSTATATALAWNDADSYTFANPQDFLTNETTKDIRAGDTVKMKLIRADYNGKIQGTGVILEVTPGQHEDVPEPAVETKTLAEFIALENVKTKAYEVTAEVKSLKSDKYGGLTLTDGTNDLIIYGCSATATALAWNNVDSYNFSNPQDFLTNETTAAIKVGDTLKMKLIRADFIKDQQVTIEGVGVVLEVTPGGGEVVPEPAVETKTLEEFMALENTKAKAYEVTAEVKTLKGDKYGNLTLTDGTNDLIIYGCSATATSLVWNNADAYAFNNPQDFLTNETTAAIKVGDTLKMKLIRADFIKDQQVTIEGQGVVLEVTPGEPVDPPEPVSGSYYQKVTTAPQDWTGDYLIVYEASTTEAYIFNGSLTSLDATSNYVTASISADHKIDATDYSVDAFTIASVTGGYSIQSKSGYYIGKTSTGNGLNTSTTEAYVNTIALAEGALSITSSGGPTLQFNKTSGQTRFRYFGSNQQAISLYVYVEAE